MIFLLPPALLAGQCAGLCVQKTDHVGKSLGQIPGIHLAQLGKVPGMGCVGRLIGKLTPAQAHPTLVRDVPEPGVLCLDGPHVILIRGSNQALQSLHLIGLRRPGENVFLSHELPSSFPAVSRW